MWIVFQDQYRFDVYKTPVAPNTYLCSVLLYERVLRSDSHCVIEFDSAKRSPHGDIIAPLQRYNDKGSFAVELIHQ